MMRTADITEWAVFVPLRTYSLSADINSVQLDNYKTTAYSRA